MKIKTLEQLGVSPASWDTCVRTDADLGMDVRDANGKYVCSCEDNEHGYANGKLLAAAPSLYEALREAIFHECYGCDHIGGDGNSCTYTRACAAKVWRKALEKAGAME